MAFQSTVIIRCGKGVLVWSLILPLLVGLAACTSKKPYSIDLMPAPDIYNNGVVNPFTDKNPIEDIPYGGVLYATDRMPDDDSDKHYLDQRGFALRLGVGRITVGRQNISWEEASRISLLKNRSDKYPLKVEVVEEIGILDRSLSIFTDPKIIPEQPEAAGHQFAQFVNEKLATSKHKDIYIYVHGYKVTFENPLLVASELWHFLGYDGVFIAFAWPSTPSTWAYASDLETAVLSAYDLRILLEFLAAKTDAEHIHIVGYSAGTRVVASALAQLSQRYAFLEKKSIQSKLRIDQVILVASDVDRRLFGTYLEEGLLKVPQAVSIYISAKDKALGLSRWLFKRKRLGQMWPDRNMPALVADYLRRTPGVFMIDVTEAEGADAGNGHAYFRTSPWVSSDVLMTLMYDLNPHERGLVKAPDLPIWTFPDDYSQRLKEALFKANSELMNN